MKPCRGALPALFSLAVLIGTASGQESESKRPIATHAGQPAKDAYGDPLPAGAVARLGTLRFRYEGGANSLAFSPRNIVAVGASAGISLWDAATGKQLRRLAIDGLSFSWTTIDFSADGKRLVCVADRQAQIWEVATGELLLQFRCECRGTKSRSQPVRFSPDGKLVACEDTVYDAATGKKLHGLIDHPASATAVAFSPDTRLLAIGTLDAKARCRLVCLVDAATGKRVRDLHGIGDNWVHALAFSADGQTLAWENQGAVVLTHVTTGKELGKLDLKDRAVSFLAFTPDGKELVCGCGGAAVMVWDVAKRQRRLQMEAPTGFDAGALSRDGKTVAVACANKVCLWDTRSGKQLFTDFDGHAGAINAVRFSPDGHRLASAGEEEQIRLWDLKALRTERRIDVRAADVAFSPDGKLLASVAGLCPYDDVDNTARIWNAATGKEVRRLSHHKGICYIDGVVFSPDGKELITAAEDGVHIWDAAGGRHLRRLPFAGLPKDLVRSPDGKIVAVALAERDKTDIPIRLYHLPTGRELPLHTTGLLGCFISSSDFSPDGQVLATSSAETLAGLFGGKLDGTLRLWEVASGQGIFKQHVPGRIIGPVAFSPQQRFVAAAESNPLRGEKKQAPAIRLWDLATAKEIKQWHGLQPAVTSLTFSPDGSRLASGLSDSTILIWDTSCLARAARLPAMELSPMDLEKLWSDLADSDAAKAHRAIWTLAAGAPTVSYLKERMRPVAEGDPKRINQLIADLDSPRFAVRQSATRELEKFGDLAEPALQQALKQNPSVEVHNRIQSLLAALVVLRSADRLRTLRAVRVLELIGTPEAREVLHILSRGATAARETQAAQATLQRLSRRSSGSD